jgi:hypothetical protein
VLTHARAALEILSNTIQKIDWIERRRTFADFEMELGRISVAGLTGTRDWLPALHLVATFDQEFLGVGIGR